MSAQLVYWQINSRHRAKLCRPFSDIRSVTQPQRPAVALLVGEIAQFDRCEDFCDEATHVPVKYRGRVMAAPVDALRMVL